MTGRETYEYVFDAKDQTGTGLNSVDRRLQQTSASMEKTIKQAGLFKQAMATAIGFLASQAAMKALDFFSELGRRAAVVGPVTQSFDALSKTINAQATQFLPALQRASGGLVNNYELMKQANNAMTLGVATSSDQYAKLVEQSIRLGRALGVDAKTAIESVTTGIGRQSKLWLDNLGIIVNTEQAYRDYAQILGKTSAELTDSEKKLAFNKAAMDALGAAVDKLGDKPFPADGWTKAATAFQNTIDSIATSPEFQKLGEQVAELLSSEDFNNFLKRVAEFATKAVEILAKAVELIMDIADAIKNAGRDTAAEATRFGRVMNDAYDTAISAWSKKSKDFIAQRILALQEENRLIEKYEADKLARAQEIDKRLRDIELERARRVKENPGLFGISLAGASQKLDAEVAALETELRLLRQANPLIDQYYANTGRARAANELLFKSQKALPKPIMDTGDAAEGAGKKIERLVTLVVNVGDYFKQAVDATFDLRDAFKALMFVDVGDAAGFFSPTQMEDAEASLAQYRKTHKDTADGITEDWQEAFWFIGSVFEDIFGERGSKMSGVLSSFSNLMHQFSNDFVKMWGKATGQVIGMATQMFGALMGGKAGSVLGGVGAGIAAGSSFGPWGAAIGGILGGLGGLFGGGKSDAQKAAERQAREAERQRQEQERLNKVLSAFTKLIETAVADGGEWTDVMSLMFADLERNGVDTSAALEMITSAIEDQEKAIREAEDALKLIPDVIREMQYTLDDLHRSRQAAREAVQAARRDLFQYFMGQGGTFRPDNSAKFFGGEQGYTKLLEAISSAQKGDSKLGGYITLGEERDILQGITDPQLEALAKQLIEMENAKWQREEQIKNQKEQIQTQLRQKEMLEHNLPLMREKLADLWSLRNSWGTKLDTLHSDLLGVEQAIRDIPRMASGGPVANDGLAYLHAGEFVIPPGGMGKTQTQAQPAQPTSSKLEVTVNQRFSVDADVTGSTPLARYMAGELADDEAFAADLLKTMKRRVLQNPGEWI